MENSKENKLTNDLALALIYLSSWKAKNEEVLIAWKGYDFSVIDELKKQGLIDFSYRSKSLALSQKGEERAKELVEIFKDSVIK